MATHAPVLLLLLATLAAMATSPALAIDSASDTVESIFDSTTDGVKLGGGILAAVAIGAGALMLVMGYKLFRATLFVAGFVAGGVALALVAEHVFSDKSWVLTASWVAFAVGGILGGSLVASLYSLGVFVAGAAGGVVLAIALQNSFGYRIYPSHPTVVLIVLCVVLGIVCGVATLKLERPAIIVATSLLGSGILVWGVGYFAGDFPAATDLKQYATETADGDVNWVYDVPAAWWGYLAGLVVLFVLGMIIQFRKTARGVQYKHHSLGKRQEQQYADVQTPPNARYGNPVSHV
jgi:hypothetical protein